MAIKGGSRPGAGRKKGTPNKASARREQEIAQSGLTPLEFMLNIMRQPVPDDATVELKIAINGQKFEAAKAAAPYVHPKLANIEHGNLNGKPLMVQLLSSDADL